jgi:hypothetical protein
MVSGSDADAIHRTWDVLLRLLTRTLVRGRAESLPLPLVLSQADAHTHTHT